MDLIAQATAPASRITGLPNAALSVLVMVCLMVMYHDPREAGVSRGIARARRWGVFLVAAGSLMNLGAAISGKYWTIAVYSEPIWKLGATIVVLAGIAERGLWGEAMSILKTKVGPHPAANAKPAEPVRH